MNLNILGTLYTVEELTREEDPALENMDGYCDKTTKRIVISTRIPDSNLGDWEVYRRKILRHEIIHAFLFESGLHECWEHGFGHDETYVDWIAAQHPKLHAVFVEAGCES